MKCTTSCLLILLLLASSCDLAVRTNVGDTDASIQAQVDAAVSPDAALECTSCESRSAECGSVDDDCGNRLECGKCPEAYECDQGTHRCGECTYGAWSTEATAVTQAYAGTDIVRSEQGEVFIAFGTITPQNGLVLTRRRLDGGWDVGPIDSNTGDWPDFSLSMDSNSVLRAVVTDHGALRHGTRTSPGEWSFNEVENSGPVDSANSSISFGLDASDQGHILLLSTSEQALEYMNEDAAGVWHESSSTLVESTAHARSALAIAPDGTVHVSYYDPLSNELRYGFRTSGDFIFSPIASVDAQFVSPSIRVDVHGTVHVVYRVLDDLRDLSANSIWYASLQAGETQWTVEQLSVGVLDKADLAVDLIGGAHLCFGATSSSSNGRLELRYGYRPRGGIWSFETLATSVNARRCTMDVDEHGGVHLAYIDKGNVASPLFYAKRECQ